MEEAEYWHLPAGDWAGGVHWDVQAAGVQLTLLHLGADDVWEVAAEWHVFEGEAANQQAGSLKEDTSEACWRGISLVLEKWKVEAMIRGKTL